MIRITAGIPCFAVAVGVLLVLPPEPRRLAFQTAFAGVSNDGQSCVWEGSLSGSTRGSVRVELRQVESAAEAASPVWHVVTRWSVVDPSGARSFDAELEGMVDWKAGTIRLGGTMADGWLKGSWVEADGRLSNGDLAGSFAITPAVARR
ncbi:MAG: hypothetical protein AUH45_03105 [Gemmatimonadetes bacterium 13_1_40CM_69_22]|nr:MAG: hypothetical protein AUH45_03105 [Gemmatimonadetes bacterium 13_1_40CM_69_22]